MSLQEALEVVGRRRRMPSAAAAIEDAMRFVLVLVLMSAGSPAAMALKSCLDVAAKGKPLCPAGAQAVCVAQVGCLTTKFPAVSTQLCEAWLCQAAGPVGPAATKK
jgi:hypothetical protein